MSILKHLIKDKHNSKLKEGDSAPNFSAPDQDGKMILLSDFKGKKLIIYFYPKDDTPGCTAESCNLRDNYSELLNKGMAVIGVSADDEKSHQKFIKKFNLPFPLIADTDKKLVAAFDVWGEKTIFGKTMEGIIRTTFIISETGIIEKIFTDVETSNHTQQILSALNKL